MNATGEGAEPWIWKEPPAGCAPGPAPAEEQHLEAGQLPAVPASQCRAGRAARPGMCSPETSGLGSATKQVGSSAGLVQDCHCAFTGGPAFSLFEGLSFRELGGRGGVFWCYFLPPQQRNPSSFPSLADKML